MTEEILSISSNQDNTCFALGTSDGFSVYGIEHMRLKERFKRTFSGGLKIVELLYKTNLLLLVGGGSNPAFPPTKLIIWDDYQNKAISELDHDSEIISAKFRKDIIIVVLANKVLVYDFKNLNHKEVFKTCPNPKGIIAVSYLETKIVAFPSVEEGKVVIADLEKETSTTIEVHKHEISLMALSLDGTLLATTSSEGTLIRVWRIETGDKVKEFRRGKSVATIYSLSFSCDSKFIVINSNRGTIHIFALTNDSEAQNRMSWVSNIIPGFGGVYSCCSSPVTPEIYTHVFFSQDDIKDKYNIIGITLEGVVMRFHLEKKGGKTDIVSEECTSVF
ncbi:WD repeat domain phosphoinositide-interacting protein, putative [Entamoeba invadens IP1]|uniref:WD repeat domain phosphoinositide-interacting protein, putative n=1 Tax=Entamoeba invadens IP1 TaxID=370355 RepID=A0A0A1UET7_ENTIV|nr:WD repeat domain phosphoinositide-interacting protein, putative [Entamoeba invadens IP1]ELP95106.1 WD repeat domain phosphoinositide-interacting protein, putative [Entamoeba invadens IP1]|eukprot:XP_004261877.1 WD repeat domain phosphoinositide-interacting protein, putative [Entamoeba invadens IP1]